MWFFKKKPKALGKVKEEGKLLCRYPFDFGTYDALILCSEDMAKQMEVYCGHETITAQAIDGYFLGEVFEEYCQVYLYLENSQEMTIAPVTSVTEVLGERYERKMTGQKENLTIHDLEGFRMIEV